MNSVGGSYLHRFHDTINMIISNVKNNKRYQVDYISDIDNLNYNYFHKIISDAESLYDKYSIKKKDGTNRIIYNPEPILKAIQVCLLHKVFYSNATLSEFDNVVTGYVRKKTLKDNADKHLSKKAIVKVDIKNFFPSIRREKIFKEFRYFGYTYEESYLFSKIVTINGSLEQGLPTSPFIANVCTKNLDTRLNALLEKLKDYKKIKIAYTRYADDLTFSFDRNFTYDSFIEKVCEIIIDLGFIPNYRKIGVYKNNSLQKVTGIVVNEKQMSISKKDRDYIRFILHVWDKYGIEESINRYFLDNTKKKKVTKIKFKEMLRSKIEFICFINIEQGLELRKNFQSLELKDIDLEN